MTTTFAVAEKLIKTPLGFILFTKLNTPKRRLKRRAGVHQCIITGHEYDQDTSLTYMEARYYNGSIGRFLSQDPAFLAFGDTKKLTDITHQDMALVLADPQKLNSYSYVRNTPLRYKDPTGQFFGVDDLAGALVGGIVGAAVEVGSSLITHQQLTWGNVGGATVAGAIVGWGTVNAPETLGASLGISAEIAGAILYGGGGAAAGNIVKQRVNIATGDQKQPLNFKEVAFDTALGAATGGLAEGLLPKAAIPGLSSGRGNMEAVGRGLETKLSNGLINNVSFKSAFKSTLGSQASNAYKTTVSALFGLPKIYQGYLNNNKNKYEK